MAQRCDAGLKRGHVGRDSILETTYVEAQKRQVQTRPPDGRKHLGSPEFPGQPPFLWPRPAWSAPQGQDVRFRPAAAREAEAEGLLRRRDRKAVPQHLQ